jgi:hypothetical protein
MDWDIVISRNQALLVRIIAALFAMLPNPEAHGDATLQRSLFYSILAVLRSAESAVRRLIVIAARGIKAKPRSSRTFPLGSVFPNHSAPMRVPTFNLIDPLKTFSLDGEPNPMFSFVEIGSAVSPKIQFIETSVNTTMLLNRLRAIRLALDNLPKQACRLARWRAQHGLDNLANQQIKRLSPFRPGPPPGLRKRSVHEVDAVLRDVHYFAREAWHWQDTT